MSKVVMKRYDAYKDSGLEWLVEVPEHWKISHLKRFCTKITDGAHTSPDLSSNDYPFLTVVNLNNGILDFENCLFTSYIDYKKLVLNGCQPKKYDVLYSKDGTISETAVIDEDRNFVVGSSFIIVRPNLKMSNSFYLCYFLSSAIMRYQARIYVKGASLPRISIFNIAKLISIIPPLLEQQAIAAYLNTKTAQIDRKVDLLTRKATQYGKLKQSLINETITRGLDKTVAMKDSGVEWIGEVPERWGVNRLKDIFNERTDKGYPDEPLLIASQDKGVTLKASYSRHTMTVQKDFHMQKLVKKADFVISLRSFEGGIETAHYQGIISAAYTVLYPINGQGSGYYKHLFKSSKFISLLVTHTTGIREGRNINYQQLKRDVIPVPNPVERQKIASYLDTKTTHIDRIVETINVQIEKLKELRKTLINDVVTGKIKVA